jgi:hypothetical protein
MNFSVEIYGFSYVVYFWMYIYILYSFIIIIRCQKPRPPLLHTILAEPDIASAAWSHAFRRHDRKEILVDASLDARNMAQVNRTASFLNGLMPHSVKAVAIVYLR